jgi:hypothetical protein
MLAIIISVLAILSGEGVMSELEDKYMESLFANCKYFGMFPRFLHA